MSSKARVITALDAHEFYTDCLKRFKAQALCSTKFYEKYKLNNLLTSILIKMLKKDLNKNWNLQR